jgi:hypothetical protein
MMYRNSNHKIHLKRIFGLLLLLAALISSIIIVLATLSFFGLLPPVPGFGVTGIVAVILLSAWSCKRLLSIVSVGITGRKGSISLSPLMDEIDAVEVLTQELAQYKKKSWQELYALLFRENRVEISSERGHRYKVHSLVAPSTYAFESGNIEHFKRLREETRKGGNIKVTVTLIDQEFPIPFFPLKARACFEMDSKSQIIADGTAQS